MTLLPIMTFDAISQEANLDIASENYLKDAAKSPSALRNARKFPTWHYSMVNDTARNRSIREAISQIDLSGKTVFEIGTGAGLTAMYFAKNGAMRVVTCEIDEQLYEIAVRNIVNNDLSHKIDIFHSSSTEFINSKEFNFSPDVIFTETLDCGVVGEGFGAVARDIAKIATSDTVILPSEIHQFGFLVSSEEIAALNSTGAAEDCDLSVLNEFSTQSYYPVRYHLYNSKSLSAVHKIKSYDYRDKLPNYTEFSIKAYRSGLCHGVVSYFHASFGSSVVTNDIRDNGHWHQAFHPLAAPIEVISGRQYDMAIFNDGNISLI